MKSTLAALALCLALSPSAGAENAASDRPALKGFDPVELVRGKEVPGSKENVVQRGAYRYAFASAENRKTFEQEPERYSIQFGGACTKMGPLSGSGHPDRFSVFEGKIYIFASDSCEAAFRGDPKRFADSADAPPAGGEAEAKAAEALLRKAVEAIGGATTTLGIDPADGRILSLAYRGRYWTPGIAQVEKVFSDFRKVGTLILPHAETASLDGKPLESLKIAVESIRVNEPLAPELFAKPAKAGP